jgi:hypothetical protein
MDKGGGRYLKKRRLEKNEKVRNGLKEAGRWWY